ncbi:MAG: DUF6599 family protein [Acidobacteriota bacterium]
MRLRGLITAGIAAVAILALAGCGDQKKEQPVQLGGIYQSLPEEAMGWRRAGPDETYDRRTLFNYIDGGAELYLSYDFRGAFVRRFTMAGDTESEIVLDIYDMGTPEEAYGIFSAEREDEDIGIGQGSEYGGGLLRFWKGSYFVSIVVIGDAEPAKPAMMELARAAAAVIPAEGERPAMLARLPRAGLREREVRYFHSPKVLNNHYFLSNEDILDLGRGTQGVLARYDRDGSRPVLLMIQYPAAVQAETACDKFIQAYMPEAGTTGLAEMENRRWTLAKVEDNLVTIVFEAASREAAEKLMSEIPRAAR